MKYRPNVFEQFSVSIYDCLRLAIKPQIVVLLILIFNKINNRNHFVSMKQNGRSRYVCNGVYGSFCPTTEVGVIVSGWGWGEPLDGSRGMKSN